MDKSVHVDDHPLTKAAAMARSSRDTIAISGAR